MVLLRLVLLLLMIQPQQSISGNSQASTVDLSSAKVVSYYQSILDTDSAILTRLLSNTGTEVVFRGYFRWGKEDPNIYSVLATRISEIKTRMPWIHLVGAITASAFVDGDYWPNGTVVSLDAKRQMLWTLPNGTMPRHFADPSRSYVLDISKPLAREFILQYAYRLIDAGFDSLWFDEVQFIPWDSVWAYRLSQISEQPYIAAWKDIVSAVKDYSRSKYGRELPVSLNGGWVIPKGYCCLPNVWPYQDFITISVSLTTLQSQSIQDDWAGYKANIIKAYGHLLPIITWLDDGKPPTPIFIFGNLPRDAQISMLQLIHETSLREDILFAYPLHGGVMSNYLSPPYNFVVYDAIKQGTYDAIQQLASSISPITTSKDWPIVKQVLGNLSQALNAGLFSNTAKSLLNNASSTYVQMTQAFRANDTKTVLRLAPMVLQLIASAYNADEESLASSSEASHVLTNVASNITAAGGSAFQSPDAKKTFSQAYDEYYVAQQMFQSKNYTGVLQHAQKALDLIQQAQSAEKEYQQQQMQLQQQLLATRIAEIIVAVAVPVIVAGALIIYLGKRKRSDSH
jgi:hypothetical protein